MRREAVAALLLVAAGPALAAPRAAQPVIDMHVHAMKRTLATPLLACTGDQPIVYPALDPARLGTSAVSQASERCPRPIASATSPGEHRDRTLAELRKHNVRRAVVIGTIAALAEWTARASGVTILPADGPPSGSARALAALEEAKKSGQVALFAEVGPQYEGVNADDPALEPFWAMAERLDVPVGIHLGDGMVRTSLEGDEKYRAALTSPFQLEAVLLRHPRLRLYIMHAASPLIDQTIAMLMRYPTLYVDVAAVDWSMPRARFYGELKRLVDAGFSERILFGSDQTLFPQAIGVAIDSINDAPFLTRQQKRDILYNNAARFLRLTPEEIAADHR